jgi:hypothetical protein
MMSLVLPIGDHLLWAVAAGQPRIVKTTGLA